MAETFDVLPARRVAKALYALGAAVATGILTTAFFAGLGWGWGVLAGFIALFTLWKLMALLRMRYVARVDASGVTVCLPTGREVALGWSEIEAHTIRPGRSLGGLVARGGTGGRVRVIPIATGDLGREGTERLLAAIKAHRPKLEYRVPTIASRPK